MRPIDVHRTSIRAILLTPRRETLLMKLQLGEPPPFWITPGGGVAPGETAEQALRRELREELGIETFAVGPLVWLRQHTYDLEGRRVCQDERYHIVYTDPFEPRMLDAHEARYLLELRWWPVAALRTIPERLTPLALADIVERYLSEGPPASLECEVLVD